jgi:hypothetical protein
MVMKQLFLWVFLGSMPISLVKQSNPDLNAEIIAAPRYPPRCFATETEGRIDVKIEINKDGDVSDVDATSGPMLLQYASVTAAWKWRFPKVSSPKVRKATLVFKFVMHEKKALNKSWSTGLSSIHKPPYEIEIYGERDRETIFDFP